MDVTYFAEEMIKSQSFFFSSFLEAKTRVESHDKFIEYDRITLINYEHNLVADEYKLFLQELRRLWKEKEISREDEKTIKEYSTLFYYVQKNKHLMNAKIQKEVKPDFILTFEDGSQWGIEETELTTSCDKVLDSIMRDFSKTKLCEEEIKKKILQKHGVKANNYYIKKYDDALTIGTGMFSVTSHKKYFSQKIICKYEKYKEMIDVFDKFVILCDAKNGIEITSWQDAEDIFEMVSKEAFHKKIELSIVVLLDDGINCFSKQL